MFPQMPFMATAVTALLLAVCGGAAAEVVGHPDPLAALASDDARLAANKRLVFDLWRGIVNGGHVELADELLAEGYIQHSPVLPTGRAAFKQIFSAVPRRETIPELVEPPLVEIVAEGPLVVMALIERLQDPGGSGTYTSTHFNLFRVENGRLAEHWHSVQTAPGPDVATPENGGPQPVTGVTGAAQYRLLAAGDPVLAANKRLVYDAWRQIVAAGREELAELYLSADFVSHNPNAARGRAGFVEQFAAGPDRPIATSLADPIVAMVAENDLVVQVRMQEHPHPIRAGATYTTTWFDMFRIDDGRLVEHWDPAVMAQADVAAQASAPAPTAAATDCAADGMLAYVCGLTNAEDIVRVGTSRWLIVSSLNRAGTAAPGRLYLVDAENRTAELLFPSATPELRHDATMFPDCDAIDLGAFDTHGLALAETAPDRYRLYATSHGALEAIQVFEVDATGAKPVATWVGCVPLPAELWANSVAILDDGGFVATQFMDPTDPDSVQKILRGEVNGVVYEWHPGRAVVPIAATEVSGPNGIELSPDGRYLFVAAFGGHQVIRFDRSTNPVSRVAVDVDVRADNLRWSERGTLLTAGGNTTAGTGWSIYEIDPAAMTAARLDGADESAALQDVSVALQVGEAVWLGTPGGDRIGYLPLVP